MQKNIGRKITASRRMARASRLTVFIHIVHRIVEGQRGHTSRALRTWFE